MLRALRDHGLDLPVIAAFAPFGDVKEATRLLHEVPGSTPYPAVAARAVVGGRLTDPAAVALETVARLRDLLAGVLLHFPGEPDERMTPADHRVGHPQEGVVSSPERIGPVV